MSCSTRKKKLHGRLEDHDKPPPRNRQPPHRSQKPSPQKAPILPKGPTQQPRLYSSATTSPNSYTSTTRAPTLLANASTSSPVTAIPQQADTAQQRLEQDIQFENRQEGLTSSDVEICRKVIVKNYVALKKYLHPDPIIDCETEFELLTVRDRRNIKGKEPTDKNEMILRNVIKKGAKGFAEFKERLRKTRQTDLFELIVCAENGQESKEIERRLEKNAVFCPEYIKHRGDWKKCIESSDEKATEQLLKDDVIPDQEVLNLACSNFGRKHQIVKDMCTKVCTYIQNLQPDIIRFVWPSYRYVIEAPFEQYSENYVVFVVVTQPGKKHSIKEVKMFKTYIRESSETSQESREVNKLEGKTTQCGDNEMKRKRRRIVKCMKENVDNLLEKHSNITSISASLFKSRHFQLGKLNTEDNLCIVLYVHVKGYIPLHEDPFDQKIDEYDVDVRECVFTPLMIGPNDFHSILKMGLEIGITSDPTAPGKESKIGTIGHFERKCFVTCAHVVMAIDELLKLSERQISGKERDINIYQPLKEESRKICGRVIRAVYDEKTGRNNVGVDAALVEITDRKSTRYEFPHSDILEKLGLTGNLSKFLQTGIYRPNHDRHTEVIKYGCVSNVTKGRYTLVSNPIVTLEALGIRLRNQIAIVPTEEFPNFAVEGDSGAVVFESMNGKLYPTCMIEGTMGDGRIVATPLINVLVALGIKNPEDEIKLYDDESDESDMDEGPL